MNVFFFFAVLFFIFWKVQLLTGNTKRDILLCDCIATELPEMSPMMNNTDTISPGTKSSLKDLKLRNRKTVLDYMRTVQAVSVNEVSHATNLSKMTVHKIIDYFLEDGAVIHAGKGVSTEEGGKKPNLFRFNADSRFIYAIRINGDALTTSIVNLKGEIVIGKKTVKLENVSFDQAIGLIADAFNEQVFNNNLSCAKCLATVVSCNGIVDVENGVCLSSYQFPEWGKNLALRDKLKKVLPDHVPVHVDSWWRHLAHGEMRINGVDDRKRFFLFGNSGDYISGGLVHDCDVVTGATGFAGEIGHLIVSPDSEEVCSCGGVGCLEALIAPSRIIRRAESRRKDHPESLLFKSHGGRGGIANLAAIGRAADKGDPAACGLLDEVVEHFAVAINNIVQICDPGTVVLFGDFAKLGTYFLDSLRDRNHCLCLHDIDTKTKIEYSELSDGCGLIGAAARMTDALYAADGK